MNYYERHLGDYTRDTAHLTLLEHGVYTMLLDRYYITEQGIPDTMKYRLARARTRAERAAVDIVLQEFFTLQEGIWVNHRAEEEIDKARKKIGAARKNGGKGGRPKKETRAESQTQPEENPDHNPTETQTKPSGNPDTNQNKTQTKAHQTPNTIPTKGGIPESKALGHVDNSPPTPPEKFRIKTDWKPTGNFFTLAKQAGLDQGNLDAAKGEFISYWLTQPQQRTAAEWDHAFLKSLKADQQHKAGRASGGNWKASEESIRSKGIELGLKPKIGESWNEYARRIDVTIEERRRAAA
ncbi:MAG: DUF1376 domain-containing protein [Oxalobacter formigenes]|nr:DUF1376 domain-containing protein [Oxalobacter formigenes]